MPITFDSLCDHTRSLKQTDLEWVIEVADLTLTVNFKAWEHENYSDHKSTYSNLGALFQPTVYVIVSREDGAGGDGALHYDPTRFCVSQFGSDGGGAVQLTSTSAVVLAAVAKDIEDFRPVAKAAIAAEVARLQTQCERFSATDDMRVRMAAHITETEVTIDELRTLAASI